MMAIKESVNIQIPERPHAPATQLHVLKTAKDEASLAAKPYTLMLPGGPGSNHSHYQDYNCLTDVTNLIFMDPRGCGLSDKADPSTYTMKNYIDDVDAIRQYFKLDHINVLGKSYGAMCALGYAVKYPAHTHKLILAAGAYHYPFLEKAKANMAKLGTPRQQTVSNPLWENGFPSEEAVIDFFQATRSLYSYRIKHNLPVNRPIGELPFNREVLNQGFNYCLRTFNYENDLSSVQSDTLILVGAEDWVTDPVFSQEMAQKIPHSELIIFQNAGHQLESDVPELFFGAIEQFLKR